MRSTTLAAPLLLELQREILEREAWPLLRVELPGQTRGYYDARARRAPRRLRAACVYEEARKANASLAIQAPENTRALSGHRPRAARARGGRPRARPQGGAQAPLVPDGLADRGARAGGGDGARRLRGLRRAARSSSTARTPSPRGAACASSRPASSTAWRRRGRSASRPRAPTSRSRSRAARGSTATASATCRAARSSPARTRRAPTARSASTSPPAPPASTSADVELTFSDGEVVERPRGHGRRVPPARAGHRRRRPPPRRARHRHELRHHPPGRHDPLRREDRRHRPPRARPLLSGDGRQERVRAALGPHLRPAPRRPPHRRRRGVQENGRFVI